MQKFSKTAFFELGEKQIIKRTFVAEAENFKEAEEILDTMIKLYTEKLRGPSPSSLLLRKK